MSQSVVFFGIMNVYLGLNKKCSLITELVLGD